MTSAQSRRQVATGTRFALCLGEPGSLQEVLEYGANAEGWGFDMVTAAENLFWWDPTMPPVWDNFTVLTTLANRTESMGLMTSVIDPVKRHPAVVAHMVATLDNISPGRFVLGIGLGEIANYGPLVDLAGPRPHRLYTRLKEFISVLHGVWSSAENAPFSFEGTYFEIENAYLSLKPATKPHPPIYIAGMGPKMKRLAGEIGDGWTPITYTPDTYASAWKDVEEAARSAGRDPNEIDRSLLLVTVVLENGELAREVAGTAAQELVAERPDLLRELGYPELADDRLILTQKPNLVAGEEFTARIPSALSESVTIAGNPSEAIEQIEAFIEAGVKLFILAPPYGLDELLRETIGHYRDTILPHFSPT